MCLWMKLWWGTLTWTWPTVWTAEWHHCKMLHVWKEFQCPGHEGVESPAETAPEIVSVWGNILKQFTLHHVLETGCLSSVGLLCEHPVQDTWTTNNPRYLRDICRPPLSCHHMKMTPVSQLGYGSGSYQMLQSPWNLVGHLIFACVAFQPCDEFVFIHRCLFTVLLFPANGNMSELKFGHLWL